MNVIQSRINTLTPSLRQFTEQHVLNQNGRDSPGKISEKQFEVR